MNLLWLTFPDGWMGVVGMVVGHHDVFSHCLSVAV